MERKFKVGDRVQGEHKTEGTIVYASNCKYEPIKYCVEWDGTKSMSIWLESDLALIDPEQKYKNEEHHFVSIRNISDIATEENISDILTCLSKSFQELFEKRKQETGNKKWNLNGMKWVDDGINEKFNEKESAYPFTVILKSGVKIGISSTMADYINEQGDDTASVQTVEDGKFNITEIAAIVPTENIIP